MYVACYLIFLWILYENLLWHLPESHLMFFLLQFLEIEHRKQKKKYYLMNSLILYNHIQNETCGVSWEIKVIFFSFSEKLLV